MRIEIAAVAVSLLIIGTIISGNKSSETKSQPSVANQAEFNKPNPDWSKVGTRLSEQCIGEILVGTVSASCKADGNAWSDGLNAKLNDPRFLEMMDRKFKP